MLRTFFDMDREIAKIGAYPYFKRYKSLSELPFSINDCQTNLVTNEMINHYQEMITKQLISKFAVPSLKPSDMGNLVNVDAAYEGIAECYLHARPNKSVLKLGLNISAQHSVKGPLFAMRCAAILAVWQLAKSRGQKVQFDVCYGYFGVSNNIDSKPHSDWQTGKPFKVNQTHIRVLVPTPTVELVKKIMSENFWSNMIKLVVQPICGSASYRLSELREYMSKEEFDFVLDRLETNDEQIEYQRILGQIERLKAK